MKPFYPLFGRILTTAVLFISLNSSVKAQTPLVAGDIAFSGYTGTTTPDQFSFVLLKTISGNTVINFTENGWLRTGPVSGSFRTGENTVTWTSNSTYTAGTEILISGTLATLSGSGGSAGTVTGTALALSTSGDQIIAYQGTTAAPTFISAIHMNVYIGPADGGPDPVTTTASDWDGSESSSVASGLPTGLTTGVDAIWVGVQATAGTEFDNARFVCGPDVSTITLARAALNDQNNWTKNNLAAPGFTLPSNCGFVGVSPLPIKLLSFTGKLNSDKTVTLQWKVEGQQDAQEYIVEESTDGVLFRSLGIVTPTGSTVYSLIDAQVLTGSNYYRLKTVELSGRTTYSNIIVVNLKVGIVVSLYPNPVMDKLTIQQFGTAQNKAAVLTNATGKVLQNISITGLRQTVDMERYAAGLYILKLDDGTIFKILKQ